MYIYAHTYMYTHIHMHYETFLQEGLCFSLTIPEYVSKCHLATRTILKTMLLGAFAIRHTWCVLHTFRHFLLMWKMSEATTCVTRHYSLSQQTFIKYCVENISTCNGVVHCQYQPLHLVSTYMCNTYLKVEEHGFVNTCIPTDAWVMRLAMRSGPLRQKERFDFIIIL